ncbi:hypothetical protein ACTNDN_06600 [Niallia sp. HCP3S3_B10]|uniref:hypothetical protein n=1 Tax=Niallia sp. HCP3S3_B10 TaxID=3438944 RepID=UPI003F89812C
MNNQVTEERSLVGSNNGDWKETWLVIGQADIVGDPIFIESYRKRTVVELYQKSEIYNRK